MLSTCFHAHSKPFAACTRRVAPVAFLLAGAALFASCPAARAQGSIIPVRVKVGILNASDGDVRRSVGTPLFQGEVDVALPSTSPGKTYVSVGYMERRKNGGTFRVVPLTISRVYSPPNPASRLTGNVYTGAGIGAYLLHASGGGDSENKTTIGGFVVVGYQFPTPYFVEAKYHQTAGGVKSLSPNGLAISAGYRF